ncbi:hypothetical protein H2200_001203 [Cladophialophora chaetospira]|uniref:Uncharacterized protein n=1 Tax=Cladophialophora chaetospira TaxID=386627 RepID=A0AA39CNU7_9EURO|nr:hypothetical protein H2200_001203 [Cladophialophora chaetospira]
MDVYEAAGLFTRTANPPIVVLPITTRYQEETGQQVRNTSTVTLRDVRLDWGARYSRISHDLLIGKGLICEKTQHSSAGSFGFSSSTIIRYKDRNGKVRLEAEGASDLKDYKGVAWVVKLGPSWNLKVPTGPHSVDTAESGRIQTAAPTPPSTTLKPIKLLYFFPHQYRLPPFQLIPSSKPKGLEEDLEGSVNTDMSAELGPWYLSRELGYHLCANDDIYVATNTYFEAGYAESMTIPVEIMDKNDESQETLRQSEFTLFSVRTADPLILSRPRDCFDESLISEKLLLKHGYVKTTVDCDDGTLIRQYSRYGVVELQALWECTRSQFTHGGRWKVMLDN